MTVVEHLTEIGACDDAVAWAEAGFYASIEEAWLDCTRPEWLRWYAERVGVDRKLYVSLDCAAARTALDSAPEVDSVLRQALEVIEAWARDEVSVEQVAEAVAPTTRVKVELMSAPYFAITAVRRAGYAVVEGECQGVEQVAAARATAGEDLATVNAELCDLIRERITVDLLPVLS